MTVTRDQTLYEALKQMNPTEMADALRRLGFAKMASTVKVVVTGLTATATPDITSASVKAAAVITGISLQTGENLPAIRVARSLRITASGTAGSLGPYIVTDAAGTAAIPPTATAYAGAAIGVALLSDDGKTITFPNTVTGFTIEYMPLHDNDPSSALLAPST